MILGRESLLHASNDAAFGPKGTDGISSSKHGYISIAVVACSLACVLAAAAPSWRRARTARGRVDAGNPRGIVASGQENSQGRKLPAPRDPRMHVRFFFGIMAQICMPYCHCHLMNRADDAGYLKIFLVGSVWDIGRCRSRKDERCRSN